MPIRTQSLLNRYLLTPPLCTSVWCEHNYSYRRSTAGCGTCPVKVVFTESGIALTGYIILPHCVLFSCRFCFLATDHLRAVACFHLCSCCASARAVYCLLESKTKTQHAFFSSAAIRVRCAVIFVVRICAGINFDVTSYVQQSLCFAMQICLQFF